MKRLLLALLASCGTGDPHAEETCDQRWTDAGFTLSRCEAACVIYMPISPGPTCFATDRFHEQHTCPQSFDFGTQAGCCIVGSLHAADEAIFAACI